MMIIVFQWCTLLFLLFWYFHLLGRSFIQYEGTTITISDCWPPEYGPGDIIETQHGDHREEFVIIKIEDDHTVIVRPTGAIKPFNPTGPGRIEILPHVPPLMMMDETAPWPYPAPDEYIKSKCALDTKRFFKEHCGVFEPGNDTERAAPFMEIHREIIDRLCVSLQAFGFNEAKITIGPGLKCDRHTGERRLEVSYFNVDPIPEYLFCSAVKGKDEPFDEGRGY